MEHKEVYAVRKGQRNAFYVLMLVILTIFFVAEMTYPSELGYRAQKQNIIYEGEFVWDKIDGTEEKIEIPGQYDVPAGEMMSIVSIIPEDYCGTTIAIRSSMQKIRFYVNGTLRKEYDTSQSRPFGKDPVSRYIFCPIDKEDAGKELRIELTSNTTNYSGVVNTVYAGSEADIWAYIVQHYGMESAIALFVFFAGSITILFGVALGIVYKEWFDIEYLGWCLLLGAMWMIGESKLRQLWVPNVSVLANLCFIVVMVCPIPILYYVNSVQKGRYCKIFRWIERVVLLNFAVSTLLQIFGVVDFIQTVLISQILIIVTFFVILITFIKGICSGESRDYHLALISIIIAMISVAAEIISMYLVVTLSGLFTGIGLLVLLLLNIVRTIRNVRDMEQQRQKEELEERRKQTESISLQTIKTLMTTVEAKDIYTKGHSRRVAAYSALIARQLGWDESRIDNLRNAAYMHDVGMIGIRDSIVNKPTKITEEENTLLQQHTIIGADILKGITLIENVENIARHHHERYDGTGYPDALSGESIPVEDRIIAIADSYDAMNSKRIYRGAMPKEEIIQEFKKNRGTQFDPKLVDIFISLLQQDQVSVTESEFEKEEQSEWADYEFETTKFISDVMSTMTSYENSDNYDFLTGLPMRSRGETIIAQLMQEHDGGLVFVDMDNLKKINDVYGHKAGDRALKLLGHLLSDVKEDAAACRLGGDEFLLFLPDCTSEQIEECMQRIYSRFARVKEKDVEIQYACLSAGICMNQKGDAFEKCYTKADKALYFVKQNGKDNFVFYQQMEKDDGTSSGTGKDLERVARALRESGSYSGALDLDYRVFAKMFEYVNSLGERYKHSCYLVMVTMETASDRVMYIENIEQALECMEKAIRKKIRKVDVCTRFSSMQYLIILFEPKESQITNVMTRTFEEYYKLYNKKDFEPRYEYIPMLDKMESDE